MNATMRQGVAFIKKDILCWVLCCKDHRVSPFCYLQIKKKEKNGILKKKYTINKIVS